MLAQRTIGRYMPGALLNMVHGPVSTASPPALFWVGLRLPQSSTVPLQVIPKPQQSKRRSTGNCSLRSQFLRSGHRIHQVSRDEQRTRPILVVLPNDFILELSNGIGVLCDKTDDATALAHLPNNAVNPVNGNQNINLKLSLARALGFSANPPSGQPDGTISLYTAIMNLSPAQTDIRVSILFSRQFLSEIDEVLGLGSGLDLVKNGSESLTGAVFPEDLSSDTTRGAQKLYDECQRSLLLLLRWDYRSCGVQSSRIWRLR